MIITEYLRKVPLFSKLVDDELEKIKQITKERFYKKGTVVITEGNAAESVYVIKSGKVKIYKTASDGREIILDIKGEDSIFAEVALFSGGKNPATVKIMEDAVIYCIMNDDIENLIKENPEMALGIIKVLNSRLQEAQRKIKNMALNDTYVRTAQTLLKLSERYGIEMNGVVEIDLSITREELASLVGTARETISRSLGQFSKEGAIEVKGRRIKILDKEKLIEWSL